jgi:hypothetical protein
MKALKCCILVVVTIIASNSAGAIEPHWTAKYKRFNGVKPKEKYEQITKDFFEKAILPEVDIDAPTLSDAIPQIQALVRTAVDGGMSVTIFGSSYAGYHKHLHLNAKNISLAELIDRLALQGDFYWDFALDRLTIYSKKQGDVH